MTRAVQAGKARPERVADAYWYGRDQLRSQGERPGALENWQTLRGLQVGQSLWKRGMTLQ